MENANVDENENFSNSASISEETLSVGDITLLAERMDNLHLRNDSIPVSSDGLSPKTDYIFKSILTPDSLHVSSASCNQYFEDEISNSLEINSSLSRQTCNDIKEEFCQQKLNISIDNTSLNINVLEKAESSEEATFEIHNNIINSESLEPSECQVLNNCINAENTVETTFEIQNKSIISESLEPTESVIGFENCKPTESVIGFENCETTESVCDSLTAIQSNFVDVSNLPVSPEKACSIENSPIINEEDCHLIFTEVSAPTLFSESEINESGVTNKSITVEPIDECIQADNKINAEEQLVEETFQVLEDSSSINFKENLPLSKNDFKIENDKTFEFESNSLSEKMTYFKNEFDSEKLNFDINSKEADFEILNSIPDNNNFDQVNNHINVNLNVSEPDKENKFIFKMPEPPTQQCPLPSQDLNNCLKVIDSPFGIENTSEIFDDFNFKMPSSDCENEIFTDSTKFFQDPSSLQFLEDINSKPSEDLNIPRSSLYVKFDPLHSSALQQLEMKMNVKAAVPDSPEDLFSVNNKHLANVPVHESVGNFLISFDSPVKKPGCANNLTPIKSPEEKKLYTEKEMQIELKNLELSLQETYLKNKRDMEDEYLLASEEKAAKYEELQKLCRVQGKILEELSETLLFVSQNKQESDKKVYELGMENERLNEACHNSVSELQSMETTFSDFHKRYEQCKTMLKTFKDNEAHLKREIQTSNEKIKSLTERSEEVTSKAESEIASLKKSSEAQLAVLKAQLKKAELKISGLENDLTRIRKENTELDGICDNLIERVGQSE